MSANDEPMPNPREGEAETAINVLVNVSHTASFPVPSISGPRASLYAWERTRGSDAKRVREV